MWLRGGILGCWAWDWGGQAIGGGQKFGEFQTSLPLGVLPGLGLNIAGFPLLTYFLFRKILKVAFSELTLVSTPGTTYGEDFLEHLLVDFY